MPRVAGGRKGLETYPTSGRQSGSGQAGAIAFATSTTPYERTGGQPPLNIITASINLRAGSQVKVEGMAAYTGSGAPARAVLTSPQVDSVEAIQSFAPSDSADYETLNFLGITSVQPAGLYTIGLSIAVVGDSGAAVNYEGPTVLVLTEIPAS